MPAKHRWEEMLPEEFNAEQRQAAFCLQRHRQREGDGRGTLAAQPQLPAGGFADPRRAQGPPVRREALVQPGNAPNAQLPTRTPTGRENGPRGGYTNGSTGCRSLAHPYGHVPRRSGRAT
jgi:hypothetical protein